jgi:hypothetical protein
MNKLNGVGGDSRLNLMNHDVWFVTDYSRFDLSVSAAVLKTVEMMFLLLPFDDDPIFQTLMSYTLETHGISDIGLKYSVLGTRCSGHSHTSIGNGLLNHFNIWLCNENLPAGSWVSYHEGDDGIMTCQSAVRDQVAYNMHLLPCLGFQVKADVFLDPFLTDFCGRFFYSDRGRLHSYCDLNRSLAKIHTICADGYVVSLLVAKMISYWFTDASTPIIGALCTVIIQLYLPLISHRQLSRAVFSLRRDYWFAQKFSYQLYSRVRYDFMEPSAACRAAVYERCGYTPGMQIQYENYYRSWLLLGHIPSVIQRIFGNWTDKDSCHVHGSPAEWIA